MSLPWCRVLLFGMASGCFGSASAASLLDRVPADTAFLYAVEQQQPEALSKTFDFVQSMQLNRLQLQAWLEALPEAGAASEADPDEPDPVASIVTPALRRSLQALIRELEFDELEQFVDRTGIRPGSRMALYGVGLVPVLRLELEDHKAFRGLLGRLQEAYGERIAVLEEFGRDDSWVLEIDRLQLLIWIEDGHVALSLAPVGMDAELRADLLERPRQAYGRKMLQEFNRSRAYSEFGSGFIKLPALAQAVLEPGESPTRAFLSLMGVEVPELSSACRAELDALLAHTPQLEIGMGRVDARRVEFSMAVRVAPALGVDLERIRGPGVSLSRDGMQMGLALAWSPLGAVEVLKERADAVIANPYSCPQFANLNNGMAAMRKALDGVPLAMLDGHTGFGVLVHRFEPQPTQLTLIVRTSKPQELLGMAQLGLPMLTGLALQPDGKPVPLAAEGMDPFFAGSQIVQTPELLALSNAPDAGERLAALAQSRQLKASPLLQFTSGGEVLDLLADLMEREPVSAGLEDPEQLRIVVEFYRKLATEVSLFDVRVNLTRSGIEMHYVLGLK